LNINLLEDGSREEARSDTKSSINANNLGFFFKVTKENSHECTEEHEEKNDLFKSIIRPWEEIRDNKYITCLGYDKEVTFHIPNYSRPIHLQSTQFLQRDSTLLVKCQHCY